MPFVHQASVYSLEWYYCYLSKTKDKYCSLLVFNRGRVGGGGGARNNLTTELLETLDHIYAGIISTERVPRSFSYSTCKGKKQLGSLRMRLEV